MKVSGVNRVFSSAALRTVLLVTTATVALLPSPVAHAQSTTSVTYSIPAGNLSTALTRWAQASGVKLLASAAALQGRSTQGLKGSHSPQSALAALLAGTGLSYTFAGSTVTISSPGPGGNNSTATVDGAIALDTIDVSGGGSGASADLPYQTPGSSAFISTEQIQRVPPSSVGDMFRNTPGVLSAGNRNGQSLDLNIRGLQGMNRVATLIDGAQQTSSTYRGYKGHNNRTFVDPELIGGIEIEKGPSVGPYGAGAMGGVVNMKTLEASDLITAGNSYGMRIRGWLGGNSIEEPTPFTYFQRFDENDLLAGGSRMGSIAAAITTDNIDVVAALAHRSNGNYFAGKNGDSKVPLHAPNTGRVEGLYPISLYKPGGEVLNTSQETFSVLAKTKLRFDHGQSLELSYVRYESTYGEEYGDGSNPFAMWSWMYQYPLSRATSSIYSAKYAWAPKDNDLIDLHTNIWMSDADDIWGATQSQSDVLTKGGEIWNTSRFKMNLGDVSLKYGGQYSIESVNQTALTAGASPTFNGSRAIGSVFVNGALDLTSWLTATGGLQYAYYQTTDDQPVRTGFKNTRPEIDDFRLNPSVGLAVKPLDGVQLFARYAEGWRPPSVREALLYMPPIVGRVPLVSPNPDLRPETSKNYEVGINLLRENVFKDGDRLAGKVVYFDNNYEDYILRGASFGSTARGFGNIPSAHFNGIEVSASFDAGTVFAEGNLSYYTNVKYCDPQRNFGRVPCADFTSDTGNGYFSTYVPPKYAGSLTLGARLLDQKLTLGGRVSFAGARAVGRKDTTSSTVDTDWLPYRVYDAFATYDVGRQLVLNFSVENLFNLYYLDALTTEPIPSPGRTMRFGTTLKF